MYFYLSDFPSNIQNKIRNLFNNSRQSFNGGWEEQVAEYLGACGVNYRVEGNTIYIEE